MKYLIYTDCHFSEQSSIINSRGKKFSTRLENEIDSISWAEALADQEKCNEIICLGDFFDKPNLTSEELTALQEIQWSRLPHTFIVGNHESPKKSLIYNSVKTLEALGFKVISEPTQIDNPGYSLLYLPYITEDDRKPLKDYWKHEVPDGNKKIVLSHNDIKGIRYGAFESKDGFELSEIETECNLFLNGHLHNGQQICKNGFNLGNLTGKAFEEDAFKYIHPVFIIDTQDGSLEQFENPFAFNFYKVEIKEEKDFKQLVKLKNNAVVSIRCKDSLLEKLNEYLASLSNICCSRVTIYRDEVIGEDTIVELQAEDHLKQFADFVTSPDQLGKDPIVLAELSEVCK